MLHSKVLMLQMYTSEVYFVTIQTNKFNISEQISSLWFKHMWCFAYRTVEILFFVNEEK